MLVLRFRSPTAGVYDVNALGGQGDGGTDINCNGTIDESAVHVIHAPQFADMQAIDVQYSVLDVGVQGGCLRNSLNIRAR